MVSGETTTEQAWGLSREIFERLLAWLGPDRPQGAARYEDIRQRLINVFIGRGYAAAEDLADETINRVARRVHELAGSYEGDPALYFFGVAHNVHREHARRQALRSEARLEDVPQSPAWPGEQNEEGAAEAERERECLKTCLKRLDAKSRKFILRYYQIPENAGRDQRIQLARKLGMTANALRIRAHRIRESLKSCTAECVSSRLAG